MLERDIETYLVKLCKTLGVHRDKFSSPQKRNVPDNILMYRGAVVFLELKAPGKKPNEGQQRDHARRAKAGACVRWTDSMKGVRVVLVSMSNRRDIPHWDSIEGDAPYKVNDGTRI